MTRILMDTGDVRGCLAAGRFGELEVLVGYSLSGGGNRQLKMTYSKTTAPSVNAPGDQRPCGSAPEHGPAGRWRLNAHELHDEYCDGEAWVSVTEGNFKTARVSIKGREVLSRPESASFKMAATPSGRVILAYNVWFEGSDDLVQKLSTPGPLELRIDGLDPVRFQNLNLDKVLAKINECEKQNLSQNQ